MRGQLLRSVCEAEADFRMEILLDERDLRRFLSLSLRSFRVQLAPLPGATGPGRGGEGGPTDRNVDRQNGRRGI